MGKTIPRFQTETVQNHTLWVAHTHMAYIRESSPPPTTLGCLLFFVVYNKQTRRRFFALVDFIGCSPPEKPCDMWHYLYPISPLARTKMAGIVWIRSVIDGKSLITQGSMSHLFRYSVKCIDVTRTTKKSFVQNDDEHDPHRRQEMKVRFTYEYDEIHVLKKTRT